MSEPLVVTWQWCCGCNTAMVICPRCGNNCCNGGYGELEDGSKCPVCPLAYEIQDRAWEDGTAPTFTGEEKGPDPFANCCVPNDSSPADFGFEEPAILDVSLTDEERKAQEESDWLAEWDKITAGSEGTWDELLALFTDKDKPNVNPS